MSDRLPTEKNIYDEFKANGRNYPQHKEEILEKESSTKDSHKLPKETKKTANPKRMAEIVKKQAAKKTLDENENFLLY